jgi:hypothetical protein
MSPPETATGVALEQEPASVWLVVTARTWRLPWLVWTDLALPRRGLSAHCRRIVISNGI